MITLSSDFGSPYPAAMKGVILQHSGARLVDVAHDFPRQDVRAAAFWLREVLPYFPPAVHLVVVDPGVGTDRAAAVVRAGEHALVGPDNGVLLPAARRIASQSRDADATGEEDAADLDLFEVTYGDPASATFHGRDVFAPAAAAAHEAGIDAFEDEADLGSFEALSGFRPREEYVDVRFPEPAVTDDEARGEVLVVDGFGNAITNIPGEVLDGRYGERIRVDSEAAPVRRTYAALDPGERLVTVGSHGNVELAANRGRGDEAFGVASGDEVLLSR